MLVRNVRTKIGHLVGAVAMRILGPDEARNAEAMIADLIAGKRNADRELEVALEAVRKIADELRATGDEAAHLRERLAAERPIAIDAMLELARADGRIPMFAADTRDVDRLRRLANAHGLAALKAELDEYPTHFAADRGAALVEESAAGTNPVTSKRTS